MEARGGGATALQAGVVRFTRPDGARSVVRSEYRYPSRNVIWQGHALRLPLGFVCEEGGHLFLRTLWMEAALRPSRRGITMVVAATFAAAREEIPSLAAIETWRSTVS